MVTRTTTREAEFVAFVSSSSRYLARTAYLLTGNTDVANDMVQESLTRTYAAWRRVRPGEARAYARRVLVNLNTDRWRRRTPAATELWDVADPGNAERTVDDRDQIARMLASLGPQQRRVIVLRYFDDLPEAEVAACLGISVGAVKSACSRGLASLRDDFAPAGKGDLS